jgi:hypothetical protein
MFKKKNIKTLFIGLSLILSLTFSATAQAKKKTTKKRTTKKSASSKTLSAEEASALAAPKKNERPEAENPPATEQTGQTGKPNARPTNAVKENNSVYFYEFTQPNFVISKIRIEHDENGKGKIAFLKKDFDEDISDPLQLSTTALERVKAAWNALNFLDSTENYQYEKDYSHLGNMAFTMKKNGKMREAKFNWTDNKDAKNLADEYRKISQQFIWIFDISVARENQPLEAPRLIDSLDSMIKRNEISDAAQMIPLLKQLNDDERIPLIARNHALKLAAQIEKMK